LSLPDPQSLVGRRRLGSAFLSKMMTTNSLRRMSLLCG
jgi:hypothetical protein